MCVDMISQREGRRKLVWKHGESSNFYRVDRGPQLKWFFFSYFWTGTCVIWLYVLDQQDGGIKVSLKCCLLYIGMFFLTRALSRRGLEFFYSVWVIFIIQRSDLVSEIIKSHKRLKSWFYPDSSHLRRVTCFVCLQVHWYWREVCLRL